MTDGKADSGIVFDIADFSSLLTDSDVVEFEEAFSISAQSQSAPHYHELKSRAVVGSPRTDFRNSNMGSRTQLRQNLDRQQVLDLEQREKQQALARQNQQQSQTIAMPNGFSGSTEVPPKVLQVKTRLQHPTEYHIKQKQQQAVKTFLTDSDDCHMPAHSMPNLALPTTVDTQWISGSAPTDMDGGVAAGMDEQEIGLLDDFILESAIDYNHDSDLHSIEPSLTQMSSTLPQQSMYAQPFSTLEVDCSTATSSSSCPPVFPSQISPPNHMTDEEQRLWAKDRQKKDNHNMNEEQFFLDKDRLKKHTHNMIERRRRYNINDRIKELGTLLPKSYEQDIRQNKGSILKASVDYIRRLKRDSDQLRSERDEKSQLEKNFQKLQLKFTQMCAVMKQQGQTFNGLMEEMSSEMMVPPSSIISMPQSLTLQLPLKTEDLAMHPTTTFTTSVMQPSFAITTQCDFMEDSSPVHCDPMLTSAPVSPDNDDSTF